MRILLALIVSIGGVGCCKKCDNIAFTAEEEAYIYYSEDENIHFANGKGDTITFTAEEIERWTDKKKCNYIVSKNGCNNHMEIVTYSDDVPFSINLFLDKNPGEVKGEIWMGGFTTPLISISPPDFDTLTIAGSLYHDVFVSYKENNPEDSWQVTRVWHNKAKGILQFSTYDPDEMWVLVD